MPTIKPSWVRSRATVCSHGSVRAGCNSSKPVRSNSSPAAVTASVLSTSNSMDAWGTIRSAGHSGVPKHASAACDRGQIPKCFAPGMGAGTEVFCAGECSAGVVALALALQLEAEGVHEELPALRWVGHDDCHA